MTCEGVMPGGADQIRLWWIRLWTVGCTRNRRTEDLCWPFGLTLQGHVLASTWAVMVQDFRELDSLGGSRVQMLVKLAMQLASRRLER